MRTKLVGGIVILVLLTAGADRVRGQSSGAAQSPPAATPSSEALRDQDIALLRKDIRSKRKQLIAANLTLTETEATKFWPVYDKYIDELVKINNEKYALIKEYSDAWGTMTDVQAENLTKRSLAVDEQVAQLRIRYVPIYRQVLPGTKVATFYQLDRRIQAMIDLQLSAQLPLVQAQE
jgi:hypothetical protein